MTGSSEEEEGCEHWDSHGGLPGGGERQVSNAGADRVFGDMQGGAGTLTSSPGYSFQAGHDLGTEDPGSQGHTYTPATQEILHVAEPCGPGSGRLCALGGVGQGAHFLTAPHPSPLGMQPLWGVGSPWDFPPYGLFSDCSLGVREPTWLRTGTDWGSHHLHLPGHFCPGMSPPLSVHL